MSISVVIVSVDVAVVVFVVVVFMRTYICGVATVAAVVVDV